PTELRAPADGDTRLASGRAAFPAKLRGMWRDGGLGVWQRWAVWAAAAVVLLLALAQVILPRIAASVISSRVGRYGKVNSVSVSAWPAVKLLWGSADSVKVRAQSLTLEPGQAAKLLWEARSTTRVDASVQRVRMGSLALSDARLSKRGSALSAKARASEGDVAAALAEFRVVFPAEFTRPAGACVEATIDGWIDVFHEERLLRGAKTVSPGL